MHHQSPHQHLTLLVALAVLLFTPAWRAGIATADMATPAVSTSMLCGANLATPAAKPLPNQGNQSSGTPDASTIGDEASLVAALEACGLTVEPAGTVSQPFFTPTSAMVLRLSGGPLQTPAEIQVYEYASAGQADTDAAQIEPDGNLRTAIIEWVAPPHFFRQDRLIVLYVGDDEAAVALLTQLLGPPFAGV